MTPRDRELAAIRHEIPDRIPADVICIEICESIAKHLGVDVARVYDFLGIDGRVIGAPYIGQPHIDARGRPTDEWRCPVGIGCSKHIMEDRPLANTESVAEVEAFAWPDPSSYDFAGAAKAAAVLGKACALRGPYWFPLFCRLFDLFGIEQTLANMILNRPVFDAAMEHVTEFTLEYCRLLLQACGDDLPILCLGDDFATQRGLMVSPDHWRKHIKPGLARIFGMAKRMGKYVWFHSCGDITAVLPDLIDIGIDVWETVQLHALPMSASDLKREYGNHIAFFGGINTQRLPFMSPAEVRMEVVRTIEDLGRNGGYICGPDHHIKPDVPVENAVALFEAIAEYSRPGYTS